MKSTTHIRLLLTLLIGLIISNTAKAQYCAPGTYLPNRYSTQVDTNVLYGSAINYRNDSVDLRMNIYYPVNDTNTGRPLVVWVHGGGFYGGSYLAGTIQTLCDSFAARGYVTATVQYRLGFWREYDPILGLFGEPYAYDINEFQRAVIRATQDVKGAIRYLKGHAPQYKIDTNWVFVGGESAGGFTALHVGYMHEQERPAAADSLADMVQKDLFNNVLFSAKRPDLGTLEGNLNLNGTTSRVQGVLNIYGALLDTSFIGDSTDPAIHQYYVLDDPIVACWSWKAFYQAPGLIFPFSGNTKNPIVYGPCALQERMNNLGFTSRTHKTWIRPSDPFGNPPMNPHGIGGGALVQYIQDVAGWLDTLICQECDSTQIINFTQSVSVMPGQNTFFFATATGKELTFDWTRNGVSVGSHDTLWVNNVSTADTGTYNLRITNRCGESIDLLFTLKLDPVGISNINLLISDIFPNPVNDLLYIKTPDSEGIAYQILNATGQLQDSGILPNGNINTGKLQVGTYILRLNNESKTQSIRFVKLP